ncbi:membrane domain protein [Mycobacterium phage Sotrice96]|nr:membrane domain protein [Mycobacterium phage Sotrice96]
MQLKGATVIVVKFLWGIVSLSFLALFLAALLGFFFSAFGAVLGWVMVIFVLLVFVGTVFAEVAKLQAAVPDETSSDVPPFVSPDGPDTVPMAPPRDVFGRPIHNLDS